MPTLLLRLAGSLQSWGTQSRFSLRDTGTEPSKSGVIGLLCAALGRSREEPVADLAQLRLGVRVDREGILKLDYQTIGGEHRRDGLYARGSGTATLSNRYYLADASFLVGLEGSEAILRPLDRALAEPVWQLFLGRKAFVPGEPVRLPDLPPLGPGLVAAPLEEALRRYPWPEGVGGPLRFVLDAAPGETGDVRADVPISFAIGRRAFASRNVRTTFWGRWEVSA